MKGGLQLMKDVLTPLAKNVCIPLYAADEAT